MKNKFLYLVLFLLLPYLFYSKGYDIEVGGSHRIGTTNTHDCLAGFFQEIIIPLSVTFYPAENDIFSVGLRNKAGYGIILYLSEQSTSKGIYDSDYSKLEMSFNSLFFEHEIYDNFSFILKAGKQGKSGKTVKFIGGIGCSFKYSFINIPAYKANLRLYNFSQEFTYYYVNEGNYSYLSIGPSIDPGFEIITKSKTFSFGIGFPIEVLFPITKIDQNRVHYFYGGMNITKENNFYVNSSLGIEFSFSFYHYKSY